MKEKIIISQTSGTIMNYSGTIMNYQDNELYIILDKIEKMNGWGVFLEPGVNKGLCTQFMLQLEKGGFIIINGKNIDENNIIEYTNLEFTEKGRKFYNDLKKPY
ncbi:MAG: hypothetical protein A2X61_05540 [Ignavibacteria bacterium GWB2_35_12]|nr:MAG: hypothetical protein A2X61_05540 [Ignavibacteria bacterium GWB2_35_12]OGU87642.1 MAG: hypothetical protein A2220_12610 [Ignavibacteria bacterium RIFOXYA2_FULL_35_10]OGV24787.1 MAG: hypothetical protein A2475_14350 [Ignavibacteria bacterium RIFOXYC2_FULL_35_21]